MKNRCPWCVDTFEQYVQYHDEEWGVPVYDDQTHFEFLVLESAQAGLSWSTVLKKREGYRNAFAEFDPAVVARNGDSEIEELAGNSAIIRNRQKIKAAVNNARRFIEIQNDFGRFTDYIWSFVDGRPVYNHWETMEEVPASTEVSEALSEDLKKRGFQFVGSVTMYAHMQAAGLVNDHLTSCFRHAEITRLHRKTGD